MRPGLNLLAVVMAGSLFSAGLQAKMVDHSHHQHKPAEMLEVNWTDAALLKLKKGRSRAFKTLEMHKFAAEAVTVYPPEAEENWELPVQEKTVKVKSRGGRQGGYHWVGAVTENDNQVLSAATVVYFSNPGPAPRQMLNLNKSFLDISPLKLPREHRHFRAGETWPFRVTFDEQPLKNAEVVFETKNQTQQTLTTDQNGIVSVTFPDDFPEQDSGTDQHGQGHGHGHNRRKKAEFVLSVKQEIVDREYISHFNFHYTTGAFYNKNLALGIGFALFGMITAAPFLRKPSKEGRA